MHKRYGCTYILPIEVVFSTFTSCISASLAHNQLDLKSIQYYCSNTIVNYSPKAYIFDSKEKHHACSHKFDVYLISHSPDIIFVRLPPFQIQRYLPICENCIRVFASNEVCVLNVGIFVYSLTCMHFMVRCNSTEFVKKDTFMFLSKKQTLLMYMYTTDF